MDNLERTFSPTEAADEIEFAPSLLRRYAAEYEKLGGDITKDKRGGRVYTKALLEHFKETRKRVQGGELLEKALRTLDVALQKPAESQLPDAEQVLAKFEERLATAQQEMIEKFEERLAARLQAQQDVLLTRLEEIAARLGDPAEAQERARAAIEELRQEVSTRSAPPQNAVLVIKRSPRLLQLEEEKQRLQSELEKAKEDLEAEKRRPWWRLWGRR